MKPRVLFIAFLLLTIKSATLSQQQNDVEETSRMHAIVGGGLSFPLNPDDFTNNWKMGTTFSGGLEFPIDIGNGENFSLLGIFDYNSFPFDEAGFIQGYNASGPPSPARSAQGPSASLWAISIGGRLYGSNSETFFLEFAIGYFSLTRGNVRVTAVDKRITIADFISKDGVDIKLGLGANIFLSNHLDLSLEASYHIAASQKDEPTGYIIFYSTGSSQIERHNTQYLTLKTGIRIK